MGSRARPHCGSYHPSMDQFWRGTNRRQQPNVLRTSALGGFRSLPSNGGATGWRPSMTDATAPNPGRSVYRLEARTTSSAVAPWMTADRRVTVSNGRFAGVGRTAGTGGIADIPARPCSRGVRPSQPLRSASRPVRVELRDLKHELAAERRLAFPSVSVRRSRNRHPAGAIGTVPSSPA